MMMLLTIIIMMSMCVCFRGICGLAEHHKVQEVVGLDYNSKQHINMQSSCALDEYDQSYTQ